MKLQSVLSRSQHLFHPVVNINLAKDILLPIDLTVNNSRISSDVAADLTLFASAIESLREEAKARFLIGGYDEQRALYSRSGLFGDIGDVLEAAEPRRLHIGTDIWGEAGEIVYAPLAGTIHSFAFNNGFGDYGATIVLRHEIDEVVFHTLYGHLSYKDIENLSEGAQIEAGAAFAHFGEPAENGQWPPHLHFQIVADMNGMKGDYPGVCKMSERAFYLQNCPDPDLILNLNSYL